MTSNFKKIDDIAACCIDSESDSKRTFKNELMNLFMETIMVINWPSPDGFDSERECRQAENFRSTHQTY